MHRRIRTADIISRPLIVASRFDVASRRHPSARSVHRASPRTSEVRGPGDAFSDVVAPTTSPTPVVPTPEPPVSASCARLPAGATKYSCRSDAAHFETEVNDAIDTLMREKPRIFNGNDVLDVGAYVVGVMKILDRKGICGDWDVEELGVARNSNLDDQFDILTARSQVRRYLVGTCYPSVVPVRRRGGVPPPAGCSLPSSVEISCGEPPSRFVDKMLAAIERVLTENHRALRRETRGQVRAQGTRDLPRGLLPGGVLAAAVRHRREQAAAVAETAERGSAGRQRRRLRCCRFDYADVGAPVSLLRSDANGRRTLGAQVDTSTRWGLRQPPRSCRPWPLRGNRSPERPAGGIRAKHRVSVLSAVSRKLVA
jgi:hypothetical protein